MASRHNSKEYIFCTRVKQYVWVGIAVDIFVAGIGINYAALQCDSGIPSMMNFGAISPTADAADNARS